MRAGEEFPINFFSWENRFCPNKFTGYVGGGGGYSVASSFAYVFLAFSAGMFVGFVLK